MKGYNKLHDLRRKWVPECISKEGREIIYEYLRGVDSRLQLLDFGCGSKGSFRIPQGIDYYGYDTDSENTYAKFHSLKEINRKFDVIVASEVLEHMEVPEIKKIIDWMKKHGNIIIFKIPIFNALNLGEMFCDSTHEITS